MDKLTINNTKGDYQSHVYVAPASLQGTTGLGQLFIIAEAKSREKKIPSILNQLVDELSEYYYHSPTKNTEAALETTAQYFNENIVDITGKNLKWVKEKMGLLLAAVQDNKLILSNFGGIKVWLFRDNKIHDITQSQGNKKTTGKKILSQLISGQLVNEDILLLTNNTIFDYFSDEKIKKTIMTLAPTQACAFFKNTLIDYKVPVDFSTIIVKFMAFKKQPQEISDISHSDVLEVDKEVEKLNQAEPRVASKIALAIGGSIKTGLKKSTEAMKKGLRGKKAGKEPGGRLGIAEKSEPAVQNPEIPDEARKDKWLKFKKWKSFNIVEYRLVILIVIVAVLFAGSLAIVNNKKELQQKNKEFETTAGVINDKINSAEAALIYKDENRAQELLAEARALLDSLQGQTADQQYTYQQLKDKVQGQIHKIYKLEKIGNVSVVANLAQGFKATSNIYISTDNIIYLARGGEVYKVNSKNKALDAVADISAQIVKLLDFEKNKLLLWTSNSQAWLMDTSNYSVRKISITLPGSESDIKDVASYAKRLYVFDVGKNNIYKYNYQTTNFSNAKAWLGQGEELAGNNSMSIDGNVWLAAKESKVSKFFKGRKEVFSLKGAYEPMSEKTTLFTKDGLKNLYLLDREKNRILIADKTGKIGRQMLGDDFENIISIVPNNNEQELYIMTAGKVYKMDL